MTVDELIEALRKCDPASKGIWVVMPNDYDLQVVGARVASDGRVELETEMPE